MTYLLGLPLAHRGQRHPAGHLPASLSAAFGSLVSPDEASPPPAALQHRSPGTRPPQRGSAARLRRPEGERARPGRRLQEGPLSALASGGWGGRDSHGDKDGAQMSGGERERGGRRGGRSGRRLEQRESRGASGSPRRFVGSRTAAKRSYGKHHIKSVTSELRPPVILVLGAVLLNKSQHGPP